MTDEKEGRRRQLLRRLWMASYFTGIGTSVAVTVLACIWIGRKADEAFGIAPAGALAGIALGFPVAIYSIYYQVRVHFGKNKKDEKNKD